MPLEFIGLDLVKTYFLGELLPYDPAKKGGTHVGLKDYLLLLVAARQAIESLKNGSLKDFDSLVGENACQIRAVKLAVTLLNYSFQNDHIVEKIDRAIQIVHTLLCCENLDRYDSLLEIIQKEKIDIPLNEDELFFIRSYLLSKVKVTRDPKPDAPLVHNEYTDTKKVKEISGVGTMFAEGLVRKLRENLSAHSVEFVQGIAAQMQPTYLGIDLTSDQFVVDHKGLQCLPCYWMTKLLMQEAQNKGVPIVMLVEQVAKDRNYEIMEKVQLFFRVTPGGYEETFVHELDPETPAVILIGKTCREMDEFPGITEWKQELLTRGPIDLILAYAAAHRQYPDATKDHLVSELNDESFAYHKAKSEEWGCSLENPSLFFLSHAYCEKIKNLKA